MKSTLLAASAFAALLVAAPAFAQDAQGSGNIGLSYGRATLDDGVDEVEGDVVALTGSFASDTGGSIDAQIDVNGLFNVDAEDGDEEFSADATINVFHRNDSFAIGVFAGGSNVLEQSFGGYGVQGQLYLPQLTIAGTIGQGDAEGDTGRLRAAQAEVRFFVSDDFRIDAGVGVVSTDVTGDEEQAVNVGVGAEYRITGTQFSVFGSYSRLEADEFDLTADVFRIGVRYAFGEGSLKARDRSGASFKDVREAFGGAASLF